MTALTAGDRDRAIALCRRVLAARPNMARGHYLAGLIALDAGNVETAEKAFSATVTLNDQHAGGWAQLARLNLLVGRLVKADGCLANAEATASGDANIEDLIGVCLRLAGRLEESLQWHDRAVATAPDHVPFRLNLANACLFVGDVERAIEALERCLAAEPDNALAHWLFARARRAMDAGHVEEMQHLVVREHDERKQAHLYYAIGKELEDLERWAPAWRAYTAGATIRRRHVDYDERAEIELFKSIDAQFPSEWLADRCSDCASNAPIFVVGQPRTGTTLLDRMLDAHPVVRSAGELRHFGFAVRHATGMAERRQFSAELMRRAAGADVTTIAEVYVGSIAVLRGDAAHIVDKLPSNFYYLPLILASLPNARIVHVTRNPLDTCVAVYKQSFGGAYLHSYDQREMARHYVRYHTLMQNFRQRFPGRFIDVAYEELVTNTEASLRAVLEYVGLSWHPDCLDFAGRRSPVATQSAAQVREAPHDRSIGRWRRFEAELEPMHSVLRAAGLVG